MRRNSLNDPNIAGHVLKNIYKVIHLYLNFPRFCLDLEVTGKRIKLGNDYGLEMPFTYSGNQRLYSSGCRSIKKKLEKCLK